MLNSFYQDDDEDEQRAMAALAAVGGRAPQTVELPQMNIMGHMPAGGMSEDDFGDMPEPHGADPVSALAQAGRPRQSAPSMSSNSAAPAPSSSGDDSESPIGWGDALGLIADIALNKSRGVGGILGNIGKGRKNKLDEEYKRAQIDHLKNAGGSQQDKDFAEWQATDRSQRDYEAQRIRELEAGRRQQSTDLSRDRFDQTIDPESALNTTKPVVAEQVAGAQARGRIEATHDMAPTVREDRVAEQDALQPGKQELKASPNYAQSVVAKGSPAAALTGEPPDPSVTGGAETVDTTGVPTTGKALTEAQLRLRNNDALARSPIPGLITDDKRAYEASSMGPGNREKRMSDVASFSGIDSALRDMQKVREENGPEMYGPAKKAFEVAQGRAASGLADLGKTGVLNKDEFERYKGQLGSIQWGLEDGLDAISGLIGKKRDSGLEGLKAVQAEIRKLAASKMAVAGSHMDYGDESTDAQAPPLPAAAAPALPEGGFDVPGDLGTAPVPPKPDFGGPMMPGKGGSSMSGLRFRKPDGKVVSVNADPAAARAAAKRKGWVEL